MKGLAVETVLYAVILALAMVLLTFLVKNLVPAAGDFITASLKKASCDIFKMGC
jgi:uncharacterized membrane protein